jgi:polysaccharide deacetylase family protein (PEP-CTERM system associated)
LSGPVAKKGWQAEDAVAHVPARQRAEGETRRESGSAAPVNGMSIDVEEFFQVWAFANSINTEDWDSFPSRVEQSVDTALRLFDDAGVCATFFVLGWIAERHPNMIRRIESGGHEIASHGYAHAKVTSQTMVEFREDVSRAKTILEDTSGQEVKGYRAPSFSIGAGNLVALDVLAATGHQYSSSIYPISHDHYGMPEAPRFAHRHGDDGILEIPMSTVNLFGRNFPCGGGGWFRFAPYHYFRWALRRLNEAEGQSAIFYFHPWELDPDQPRVKQASRKARFRHYINLGRMERDLARLLSDFRWDRLDRVFLDRV